MLKRKQGVNPLVYLGFLGALGSLGALGGNKSWLGLLGLFGIFSLIGLGKDERIRNNINKAARNGFFAAMIGLIAAIVTGGIYESTETAFKITVGLLPFLLLVFLASFFVYEARGE